MPLRGPAEECKDYPWCVFCQKDVADSKTSLTRHLQSQHRMDLIPGCPKCHYYRSRRSDVEKHCRRIHGIARVGSERGLAGLKWGLVKLAETYTTTTEADIIEYPRAQETLTSSQAAFLEPERPAESSRKDPPVASTSAGGRARRSGGAESEASTSGALQRRLEAGTGAGGRTRRQPEVVEPTQTSPAQKRTRSSKRVASPPRGGRPPKPVATSSPCREGKTADVPSPCVQGTTADVETTKKGVGVRRKSGSPRKVSATTAVASEDSTEDFTFSPLRACVQPEAVEETTTQTGRPSTPCRSLESSSFTIRTSQLEDTPSGSVHLSLSAGSSDVQGAQRSQSTTEPQGTSQVLVVGQDISAAQVREEAAVAEQPLYEDVSEESFRETPGVATQTPCLETQEVAVQTALHVGRHDVLVAYESGFTVRLGND